LSLWTTNRWKISKTSVSRNPDEVLVRFIILLTPVPTSVGLAAAKKLARKLSAKRKRALAMRTESNSILLTDEEGRLQL
jgi:hypothetical protein